MGNCVGQQTTMRKQKSLTAPPTVLSSQVSKKTASSRSSINVIIQHADGIDVIEPSQLPSEQIINMILENPQEIFLQVDLDTIFKNEQQNFKHKSQRYLQENNSTQNSIKRENQNSSDSL